MAGPVKDIVEKGKAWYKSKAIIGGIVAIIPTLLKMINPEWGEVDVEGVVDSGFETATAIAENADALWVTIMERGGALLALIGLRLKKKPIAPVVS